MGLHYNNVAVWRKRFSQALPTLSEVEANTPDKLEAEIKQLPSDKQRSGHPTVFTAEHVMKIINLACCKPEPEIFAEKINEICEVYRNAQEISRRGGYTISTEEMTGIQALEHKYPDKSPLPGQCAEMEFEYIRHGTTSLISFMNIATGRIEAPYLNQTYEH